MLISNNRACLVLSEHWCIAMYTHGVLYFIDNLAYTRMMIKAEAVEDESVDYCEPSSRRQFAKRNRLTIRW
jgi:hypothetical protein